MQRGAGILMPISSLPCKFGVGSLGGGAYRFVDYLKAAGQKYWQILPITHTGYGDNPYKGYSSTAGNPYFIDIELLHKEGLLTRREITTGIEKSNRVDYGKLYNERFALLRIAFERFNKKTPSFVRFVKEGEYSDYACFMALHTRFNRPFYEWPLEYKYRNAAAMQAVAEEGKDEILFWQFVQYLFWAQWGDLKRYANSKGISIIGEIPMFIQHDSVDVWAHPECFMLDGEGRPTKVSGTAPDFLNWEGQIWGDPVYNYAAQAQDGFAWWKNRLNHALSAFDYVYIDHFRAFNKYWAVNAWASSARDGEWLSAPAKDIFAGIDMSRVIAEDLGYVDENARNMMNDLGVPGTKVMQYAFGGDDYNPYLPWNVKDNSVYYMGTPTCNTMVGFIEAADEGMRAAISSKLASCFSYSGIYRHVLGKYDIVDSLIDVLYASRANVVIVPMHDVLGFGSEYRIAGGGEDWTIRYRLRLLTETTATLLARKARRFER